MSNPHSPEPSRWILEMFAPDIPAWNRAFNQLERKVLNATEVMLVHSFDRYLRRKGYLTKRQVEVLGNIAKKHDVALPPIPPTRHHAESSHTEQEATALLRIPELEKPQNVRWLALLIDTEGSLGWRRYARGKNRVDERWRYWYTYRAPYVGVGMLEVESKRIIEEGARLVGWKPRTQMVDSARISRFDLLHGRALSTMRYMAPYLVKFNRLAKLCVTLFKHHTLIPTESFDKVVETLFGKYVTPKEANTTLLEMSQNRFQQLLKQAEQLTDTYLKRPWRPPQRTTPFNNSLHNPIREEKELLIMRATYPTGYYSVSLAFKKEDLPLIKKALEPLGYTLRFPRRS